MTLAWDPNPDPQVAGYKVYYGPSSGVYTNAVAVGVTTNASVPGLLEGSAYYFAATTTDSLGQESDFSQEISYVTTTSSNVPPTLNILANLTINENASLQTVNLSGITSGSTNETQTLAVTAASSNPGLIPVPSVSYTSPNTAGSISFTPAVNGSGSATLTVTVNDGGASNNVVSRSFTVTVNPVNQPPTLNALANITINENASLQTVNLSGIGSGAANENQTLTVSATSSNPGLIPTPAVAYSSPSSAGNLTFTPVAFGNGSATITVTVNDGGTSNNIVIRTFVVTVNPVNQPPTLNALANVTVIENATAQTVNLSGISSGAVNENQTLTVTATSGNTTVLGNPTVTYSNPSATGTLSLTPKPNAFGTATVTVTVNDGGASNNIVTRTFVVTVDAPPTISAISNRRIAQDTQTGAIAFTVVDADTTVGSLIVSAVSSNLSLVPNSGIALGGSGANRTVTVTPLTGQAGTANITLTVSDGLTTATSVFQVTVQGKPIAPGNLRVVSQ